jgi:hypothetical protein
VARNTRLWQDPGATSISYEGDVSAGAIWLGYAKAQLKLMLGNTAGPLSATYSPTVSVTIRIDTRPNRIHIKAAAGGLVITYPDRFSTVALTDVDNFHREKRITVKPGLHEVTDDKYYAGLGGNALNADSLYIDVNNILGDQQFYWTDSKFTRAVSLQANRACISGSITANLLRPEHLSSIVLNAAYTKTRFTTLVFSKTDGKVWLDVYDMGAIPNRKDPLVPKNIPLTYLRSVLLFSPSTTVGTLNARACFLGDPKNLVILTSDPPFSAEDFSMGLKVTFTDDYTTFTTTTFYSQPPASGSINGYFNIGGTFYASIAAITGVPTVTVKKLVGSTLEPAIAPVSLQTLDTTDYLYVDSDRDIYVYRKGGESSPGSGFGAYTFKIFFKGTLYDTNDLVEQQIDNYISSPYAKGVGISPAYPIFLTEGNGGGYAFDGKTLVIELHYYTLLINTTAPTLVSSDGTRYYKKYTHRASLYLDNSTSGPPTGVNMIATVSEY